MKDINWLINRLKAMNAKEIVWRIQQKTIQNKEYKYIYLLNLPVTDVLGESEISKYNPDINKIPLNWDNANYVLFTCLDIFGKYDYNEYKKKWNAGFQTNNTWPEHEFSYKISISQREDIGDIRTNWELNRHYQFIGLAKNYYVTSDSVYLDELKDLFYDWNNKNKFLHGVEWTSAMELGIRVVAWIYMYSFIKKRNESYKETKDEQFLNKILSGIVTMVQYIIAHRAKYTSANNHLIIEMFSVAFAGIFLNRKDWLDLSLKILSEELVKQNYKDGVNKEMSLHYQSFVMEAYGILYLTCKKNNIQLPDFWKKYLSSMSEFLADCCGEYGEVIVFGDNDEGKIIDFLGKQEDYYRYVLQLMGMILDKRYIVEQMINENIYWLVDKKDIEQYRVKDLYIPQHVSCHELGGYTILRSKDRKVLIGMDHAKLGFGAIAAHGHADALSIQVFYEGHPVLVDAGTYNYHVPDQARNEYRSTRMHNTVWVKCEQAEMLGPFLWGKRYKVNLVDVNLQETYVEVKAQITYKGISHLRKVIFDYNRKIIVVDNVKGTKEAQQIWHFSPEGEEKNKTSDFMEITSTSKDKKINTYSYSKSYGWKEDAQLLEYAFSTEIATEIKLL